jgi:hypothetical protein
MRKSKSAANLASKNSDFLEGGSVFVMLAGFSTEPGDANERHGVGFTLRVLVCNSQLKKIVQCDLIRTWFEESIQNKNKLTFSILRYIY